MKLAEALQLRSDLNNKIFNLRSRLNQNSKVQEGDEPSENPMQLLDELDIALNEYGRIIAAINLTNCSTSKDGETITDLLAKKDTLNLRIGIMRTFLDQASMRVERSSGREIKVLSTVNVPKLQKELDCYSAELRKVNASIQELNWTTELIEK